MKDENLLISGFEEKADSDSLLKIDFAGAKQLSRGGSTCDTYECTIQRRRIFIKRLKEEFRDNPLYRGAYQKEYELGVTLTHPSLPRYVGYGEDFIAMDYIEGDTLAELIKRGDRRFNDKKYIKEILSELIDVVEYLHHHNIVHCDIKSDNVIISPFRGRPPVLIDLDKAYSAWLGTTSGNPGNYDCNSCEDGIIDFHGIGNIAAHFGLKGVANASRKKDVTPEALHKALKREPIFGNARIWMIAACAAMIFGAIYWWTHRDSGILEKSATATSRFEDSAVVNSSETLAPEEIEEEVSAPAKIESPKVVADNRPSQIIKESKMVADENAPVKEDINELDEIVKRYYNPLYRRLDYLRKIANNPKTELNQLEAVIKLYAQDQMSAQSKILREIMILYGMSNPLEASVVAAKSKEWRRFMKQDAEIDRLYCREIEKRELPKDSVIR